MPIRKQDFKILEDLFKDAEKYDSKNRSLRNKILDIATKRIEKIKKSK